MSRSRSRWLNKSGIAKSNGAASDEGEAQPLPSSNDEGHSDDKDDRALDRRAERVVSPEPSEGSAHVTMMLRARSGGATGRAGDRVRTASRCSNPSRTLCGPDHGRKPGTRVLQNAKLDDAIVGSKRGCRPPLPAGSIHRGVPIDGAGRSPTGAACPPALTLSRHFVVEPMGLEPRTPCLQCRSRSGTPALGRAASR